LLVSRGSGCIELDLPSPPSSEGGFFALGSVFHGSRRRFADHFLINPAKWRRLIPEVSD